MGSFSLLNSDFLLSYDEVCIDYIMRLNKFSEVYNGLRSLIW
jgi:hypothetical protein